MTLLPAIGNVVHDAQRAMLPFSPQQLPEDLRDLRVLEAMERIPRRRFLPDALQDEADKNIALEIGHGQTISQPYIVAYMSAALQITTGQRILEIGTGSGYQSAILASIGAEVFSVEIIPELSQRAELVLRELGLSERVHLRVGDGRHGWMSHAPYDGIVCTAAPLSIPLAFIEQAKVGARIVVPVGRPHEQQLRVLQREEYELREIRHIAVRFVPLVRPEPVG